MKKILVAVIILLSGCLGENQSNIRYAEIVTLDSSTIDMRAKFILTCLKNANPKSDEEPEDWMKICGELAKKTYGNIMRGYKYHIGWGDYSSIVLCKNVNETHTVWEREICANIQTD